MIRSMDHKDLINKIEAKKYDGDKPRTDLLPVVPLLKTASVFGYGAKKYNDYNYANGDGLQWSRLYGACLRHMFAWWQGEDMDESGHNHLYHAICELLMLAHLQELGKTKGDDRIG